MEMIAISNEDARKLIEICADYARYKNASLRPKERDQARISRQLKTKLDKKLNELCYLKGK